MCHFLWTGNPFNTCRQYLCNFNRKVPGVSLETLSGQYRPLGAHLWQAGWGLQKMQRSQSKKASSTLNPSFPSFPIIKSHKSNIFSGNVFLSSSLWKVIFGGPETLKFLLRNKLPATPQDFRTHCSSSSGATLHLCTHPSYPSFNNSWCNPGM